MLLSTQIQVMLYAFLCGLLYGFFFSMKQYISRYIEKALHKALLTIIYHIIFTCLMFYGLYKLNGGISNIYLLLLFVIGTYMYYVIYYDLFIYLFDKATTKGKPYYFKWYLLISRFYCIMNKQTEKVDKVKRHGRYKRKKKKESVN